MLTDGMYTVPVFLIYFHEKTTLIIFITDTDAGIFLAQNSLTLFCFTADFNMEFWMTFSAFYLFTTIDKASWSMKKLKLTVVKNANVGIFMFTLKFMLISW